MFQIFLLYIIITRKQVFTTLSNLFPKYACEEFNDAFNQLVTDKVFTSDEVPQLEDVSKYLKGLHLQFIFLKIVSIHYLFPIQSAPRVLSPFRGGGLSTSMTPIAMLAGVFILLLGPPKPDRLKDRGQTK